MNTLMKLTNRQEWHFTLRLLGVAMVIVGVVTAACKKTFAGFTPIIWFLLALCAFVGVLYMTLFRIEARLESKMEDYVARSETRTEKEKSCPSCGCKLPRNAKFCRECGARMEDYIP